MKNRILIFLSILIILILISAISIVINNQQSKSAEADCASIVSQLKVCYCMHCKEGGSHPFPGIKCSSDGGIAGPSDDNAANQGCQMSAIIVPAGQACP